jgi:hypothetical protein
LCQNYEDTDESKRFFNIFHLVFPPLSLLLPECATERHTWSCTRSSRHEPWTENWISLLREVRRRAAFLTGAAIADSVQGFSLWARSWMTEESGKDRLGNSR